MQFHAKMGIFKLTTLPQFFLLNKTFKIKMQECNIAVHTIQGGKNMWRKHTLFLSRIDPLPSTEILAPVSSWSLLMVLPWGPRILPTKLNCEETKTYIIEPRVPELEMTQKQDLHTFTKLIGIAYFKRLCLRYMANKCIQ